jgi:hypothetical protein
VVSLKHLLLACLCAAALGPHFTYRVPGRFLPLLLPLVGLALGVVQVAMVLRYALGRVLGAPIALIVRAERVATLTAVGFVTYSVAMAANGAWSTLPAREHRSEVLGIVRREVDVGTVLSGVAWVELRSWRATGAIERVPLLWSEERVLWPGKAVLVKVRPGYLGIPWVASIERDDEQHYLTIVERLPTATLAWKRLVELYEERQQWPQAAAAARRYFERFPGDLQFAESVVGRFGVQNSKEMVIAVEPVLGRRPHYHVNVMAGVAMGFTGQASRGLALIDAAMPLEPENHMAYLARGLVLHYGLRRLEEAVEMFEAALARRAGLPEALSELAIVRRKLAAAGRPAPGANAPTAAPGAR